MRSWQAARLVRALYYVGIAFSIWVFIEYRNKNNISNSCSCIVSFTKALGAGGFFLGLLVGAIYFLLSIIASRIVSEVVLSVFVIRDSIAANGKLNVTAISLRKTAGSEAPQNVRTNAPYTPAYVPPPAQPQDSTVAYQASNEGYQTL